MLPLRPLMFHCNILRPVLSLLLMLNGSFKCIKGLHEHLRKCVHRCLHLRIICVLIIIAWAGGFCCCWPHRTLIELVLCSYLFDICGVIVGLTRHVALGGTCGGVCGVMVYLWGVYFGSYFV